MKLSRLPIIYEIPDTAKITLPFFERRGQNFEDSFEEFADVCLNNLTFAAYNLLRWKGKPLKLAPFQSCILETLWGKTFPILLMTRGGGKCITGDSIIQTSSGFSRIDSICSKKEGATPATISMFGESGFRDTSFVWTNPAEKLYEIETRFGYTIKGVGKHKVRIIEDGNIVWKELKDFDGSESVCISRDSNYQFSGDFNYLSGAAGYLFGALIGDGCFAASKPTSIGFTNKDVDIVKNVREACNLFNDISFKDRKDPIEFSLNFGSRENKLLFLDKYGFKECKSKDKTIPSSILQSNKNTLAQFISGYFDTDGTVNSRGVSVTSISEKLIRQLQTILLSYGIISSLRIRSINQGDCIAWTLDIRGEAALVFQKEIGFRCLKKQALLNSLLDGRKFNSNKDLLRNSKVLLLNLNRELKENKYKIGAENRRLLAKNSIERYDYSYRKIKKILDVYSEASELPSYKKLKSLYDKHLFFDSVIGVNKLEPQVTFDVHIPNDHTFISNGFISHNTFMLAVYAVLRAMLTPGSKVVIVASSFRQSKLVFEYIEQLYGFSPILRACCPRGIEKPSDSRKLMVGTSSILALPLGNGEKIRGIRATHILTDEFASIPPEIFQVVVRGFAAVSADPIEAASKTHQEEKAIKEGVMEAADRTRTQGNQIVYSGTANFQFNHFYKLYMIHKRIIESKFVGNADEINDTFQLGEDEAAFDGDLDYRDYAIIQIPYQGLPKSFMDEKQIAQARATMPKSLFQMEYECTFPTDSDGFFRRSMINAATPGMAGYSSKAPFSVEVRGQPGYQYVMGIDPARKTDNFAISILKLMKDGTYRNVFCDSMNGKRFPEATRRVRELLKRFNVVRIAMDAGGGGLTVEDLLSEETMLQPGEAPIWKIDDDETARFEGLHILDMVNFNPTWLSEANYGLAADIEHRRVTFPYRTSSVQSSEDHEKAWDEIDQQINEMCMIVVTATKTGIQHFDVPELPGSQQSTLKHSQRKDRYSAMLLSSYAARSYMQEGSRQQFPEMGGWVDGAW